MKDTDLMLDVGQANELKLTFRREGWNNKDIKTFCEKKGLGGEFLDVLHGKADIVKNIFTFFDKFTLPPVSEHNTKDCFQNSERVKFWRDEDTEIWKQTSRKAHQGGCYIINNLTQRIDYRELVAGILGINLKIKNISDAKLQQELIDDGHCVEIKQIDQEIRRFEDGIENSPFVKDDKSTFFFVDNQKNKTVSIISVSWCFVRNEWRVRNRWFGFDHWLPGCRVVSREYYKNLDKEMFNYMKDS